MFTATISSLKFLGRCLNTQHRIATICWILSSLFVCPAAEPSAHSCSISVASHPLLSTAHAGYHGDDPSVGAAIPHQAKITQRKEQTRLKVCVASNPGH